MLRDRKVVIVVVVASGIRDAALFDAVRVGRFDSVFVVVVAAVVVVVDQLQGLQVPSPRELVAADEVDVAFAVERRLS